MDPVVKHYHEHAAHYQRVYDSVSADAVHANWLTLLNHLPIGHALDVGAGSGRDARWLAQRGWHVTAVEPARDLFELAAAVPHKNIRWLQDELPDLSRTPVPERRFDLILLCAVWMHIKPEQRSQTMQRLIELLSDSGVIVIIWRQGPSESERPMYPVSADELAEMASHAGLMATCWDAGNSPDMLGREGLHWQTVSLRRQSKAGL